MNLLKSVETTIANLVEGAFGRVFRTEVRPMELARKLAREMDAHRTRLGLARVRAQRVLRLALAARPRALRGRRARGDRRACAYLLEHARREDLILASPPHITFHTDERLSLGEFGIQARLVRAGRTRPTQSPRQRAAPPAPPRSRAIEEHGQTMIYSTLAACARSRRGGARATSRRARALLARRRAALLVPPGGRHRSGAAATATS